MSKRAEENALKLFPDLDRDEFADEDEYIDALVRQHSDRALYIMAYRHAEKDLALSIDDLEQLHALIYAVKNNKQGVFTFTKLTDEQYEEVLRRFNKIKEQKE